LSKLANGLTISICCTFTSIITPLEVAMLIGALAMNGLVNMAVLPRGPFSQLLS